MTLLKGEPIFCVGGDLSDVKFEPSAVYGMWRGEREEGFLQIVIEQEGQRQPLRELLRVIMQICDKMGRDLQDGNLQADELIEYLDETAAKVNADQGDDDEPVTYRDCDIPVVLAAIMMLGATGAMPINEHYCVSLIRDGDAPTTTTLH